MVEGWIGAGAGMLQSLAFGYIPGLRAWYDALDSGRKAAIMGLTLVAVALGGFALSCVGPFEYATCDEAGGWELVGKLVAALLGSLVGNQSTYMLMVKPFKKGEAGQ